MDLWKRRKFNTETPQRNRKIKTIFFMLFVQSPPKICQGEIFSFDLYRVKRLPVRDFEIRNSFYVNKGTKVSNRIEINYSRLYRCSESKDTLQKTESDLNIYSRYLSKGILIPEVFREQAKKNSGNGATESHFHGVGSCKICHLSNYTINQSLGCYCYSTNHERGSDSDPT